MIGTCFNGGHLEFYEFDVSDPEDMGEYVLSLPHANSMDISAYHSTVLDAEGVMKFIRDHWERKPGYDFHTHAYELVSKDLIGLYYSWEIYER